MISPTELSSLQSLLSDENKTFEHIASSFQKTFSKFEQFKVGITLWFLIKENLLNLPQRLISFYLLYDIYKQEQSLPTTPFIPLLLESLDSSKIHSEKALLISLLDMNFPSSKQTIKQYIDDCSKNPQELKSIDIPQLWKNYNTTKEQCTKEINDWIRPVIYDDNSKDKCPDNIDMFDLTELTEDEISFNEFKPSYLTYYPNTNYEIYDNEPMWILPTLKYDFIWDFTMSPEEDTISNLIHRSLENKELSEEQTKYLLETIGENQNILDKIKFTPDLLMELIEKKEALATEIMVKISRYNSFEKYLNPFLTKTWSINSMIVINKVIQKVSLPDPFISGYIKKRIENYINETETAHKTRLARLLGFFTLNLLENGHITINTIPQEIDKIFDEKSDDEDMLKLKNKIYELRKPKDDVGGRSSNFN